jgi:RNA polymerase sigma-70 factor (ECF subfamily)
MSASQRGDAHSYQALLTDVCFELIEFYSRFPLESAIVEQLTHDTLLAIHAYRATYDPKQCFAAWAGAIARHKLGVYLRRTHNGGNALNGRYLDQERVNWRRVRWSGVH